MLLGALPCADRPASREGSLACAAWRSAANPPGLRGSEGDGDGDGDGPPAHWSLDEAFTPASDGLRDLTVIHPVRMPIRTSSWLPARSQRSV